METVWKECNAIRKRLGLRGWVDIDDVIRQLGYRIDELAFTGPNVREVTVGNSIGVKRGLSTRERRWALAHGLGHLVLHSEAGNQVWLYLSDKSSPGRQEQEAETFAHHLLIDFAWTLHTGMGESWEVATYYGVPLSRARSQFGGFE